MLRSPDFARFTQPAREALTFAEEEARRLDHPYIGTEHLLLGVMRLHGTLATRVLDGVGLTLDEVREALETILGRGDTPAPRAIGLTPRAVTALTFAEDASARVGDDGIGPEHLLLGLIAEQEGLAAGILTSLGVSSAMLESAIAHEKGEDGASATDRQHNGAWTYREVHVLRRDGGVYVHSIDGSTMRFTPMRPLPLRAALAALGGEGWELVSIRPALDGEVGSACIFRRKVDSGWGGRDDGRAGL